ncbi:hypothetical protein ACFO0A_01755 [Novosphingobium tardum]|uniref:Tetratricopeptide repeat protein n=1 Tax=Novosphingobium tardum TaxID=1538021 RepID=A0ABV8RK30_9SPHN
MTDRNETDPMIAAPPPLSLPLPLFAEVSVAAGPTIEDDRLQLCLQTAAKDPPSALAEANRWLAESRGAGQSKPLQCLGQVYTVLLRWEAAETAFTQAATVAAPGDLARRAALHGQAGNAAIAGGHADRALGHFDMALAVTDLPPADRGQIELDRGRALVALNRLADAAASLTAAQRDAPDEPLVWLLSATLARRQGDLGSAQRTIEVAATLAPTDPDVGLEAGVIAVLGGRDEAARKSWQSVIATSPQSKAAATAKSYIEQLGPAPAPAKPPAPAVQQ